MQVRRLAMHFAGILLRGPGTLCRCRQPIPACATVAEVGPDYKNPMWMGTAHCRGTQAGALRPATSPIGVGHPETKRLLAHTTHHTCVRHVVGRRRSTKFVTFPR